ncbi:AMP-binding protein [Actinomadura nitritigenes]|uniref:AMP-binding protein n=1 Tax=Actinomadura nitritigenes TaxID=134602 RepID=UPI003D92C184
MQASAWIASHALRIPRRQALQDLAFGRSFTYEELSRRIDALAAHLTHGAGVRSGDRVVVLARNSHHVVEIQYACAAIGAVFVPLNWRLNAEELVAIGQDCAPALVLHESFFNGPAASVSNALDVPALSWDSDGAPDAYEEALAAVTAPVPPIESSGDAPWTIIYTSGTTGRPKGVILSHASAMATMLSVVVAAEISASSLALTALPMCHVAGLNLFTNPALYMGATVVLMREYDAALAFHLLTRRTERVTHFCGVPANYQFMQKLDDWDDARFDGLTAFAGGSPVPEVLVQEWADRGAALQTVYGISEAGAAVLLVPRAEELTHKGTVGLPLMHIRARVVDGAGTDVPTGEVGELLIAGPSRTPGYWGAPDLTAQTIDTDGWLHTGDAAFIDQSGYVHLVDRFKDMYISGGENVYPAEVENVLHQHPAVAEVAVVGVPDERWGECGHAYIVPTANGHIDPDEIRDFARARLAAYKAPKHVTTVTELPRNTIGKILKRTLREKAATG